MKVGMKSWTNSMYLYSVVPNLNSINNYSFSVILIKLVNNGSIQFLSSKEFLLYVQES